MNWFEILKYVYKDIDNINWNFFRNKNKDEEKGNTVVPT